MLLASLALLLLLDDPSAPAAKAASEVRGVVRIASQKAGAGSVVSLHGARVQPVPSEEPVTIAQKGFRFVPRIVAVGVGTTVRFQNDDPEPQNVYSPEVAKNLGVWPTGASKDLVFRKAGVYSLLSGLHPDMLGYVVVLDTPYFVLCDESGRFAIRDVAEGKYRLEVWREGEAGLAREIIVERNTPLDLQLVLEK